MANFIHSTTLGKQDLDLHITQVIQNAKKEALRMSKDVLQVILFPESTSILSELLIFRKNDLRLTSRLVPSVLRVTLICEYW